MPKERFHLLLADQYLKSGKDPGPLTNRSGNEHLAFFIGALSPDIFFYDLPTFLLNRFGERLHRVLEREGLDPIEKWLMEEGCSIPKASFAWGIGFASHFIADSIWHPVINGLAESLQLCRMKGLQALGCHRLIESEMESYWFGEFGIADGYSGFLRRFATEKQLLGQISATYRGFLAHAGFQPLPSLPRIRRCYLSQNYLLRIFAGTFLNRKRDRLLSIAPGRYVGTLIVPKEPVLPYGPLARTPAERDPFSGPFMNSSLISLTSRLAGFAERLAPFLPS